MSTLRFHGHACFSLSLPDGRRLLLDPFEPGGLGGAVRLPALPDVFDLVACTHHHVDHNAVHAVPSATPVAAPWREGDVRIDRIPAAHDEYGGRLRGGHTDILVVTTPDGVVAHCGDLGERPEGPLLEALVDAKIDVLIVPVGGYFTLGADGAAELVARLKPRVAVPCHSADDGVALPALGPRTAFLSRFATHVSAASLYLPLAPEVGGIVVLERDTSLTTPGSR